MATGSLVRTSSPPAARLERLVKASDTENAAAPASAAGPIWIPLRTPLFRRIWLASLLSNLGLLILGVGAAWAMTQLTSATGKVALVQTAMMLPIMLFAIPAGAMADMYDRRRLGIFALTLSLMGASVLSALTFAGLLSPTVLLVFCFIIGSGMALFGPAWQASVSEQVPAETLPQAVALNSISYNIARSFGPAIGGMIVAAAGAVAAFLSNALLYLPLLIVLLLWKRIPVSSRLPPERIERAITSGVRYVIHSPTIRVVLWRTLMTAIAGGSVSALMPIVARDILRGDASTYGLILGAFGIGAVVGGLNIAQVRARLSAESAVSLSCVAMGLAVAIVAFSPYLLLTMAALFLGGISWMVAVTLFNIGVQLSAPRWVAGRTLAAYQAAVAGGVAIGSWFWGQVAQGYGVSFALAASATALVLMPLVGRWLPVPPIDEGDRVSIDMGMPDKDEVGLALTARSGPIVIEVEYRVDPTEARAFYSAMQQVQQILSRNGAFDWSIARDIADPWLWVERFHCPTWLDYLRLRSRHIAAELEVQDQANGFHRGDTPIRMRRMLERPFGSVRWKDDAPDTGVETRVIAGPNG
jgi:MFS family permease